MLFWWPLACGVDDGTTPQPTDVAPTETGTTTEPTSDTAVPARGPTIVDGPTLGDPPDERLRLVRMLAVTSDVPTRASVLVDDGERRRRITFPTLQTEHQLPILQLFQATTYDLTVTLTDEGGHTVEAALTFDTATLPDQLPELELLVDQPTAEPGLRVFPVGCDDAPFVVLAVDHQARPVWALVTTQDTKALSFEPQSSRFAYLVASNRVQRTTPWGTQVQRWSPSGSGGAIPVDVPGFHHEAAFEADGSFWSLNQVDVDVPAFPVSELTPTVLRPATISSDVVIHVAEDGTILGRWPLHEIFPTERIGYDSFEEWAHSNAIVPLSDEDAFLVSMRHQDAVARVRQSTGEVEWVLANHDGWPAEWADRLLEPTGTPFAWQYHQHAPFLASDGSLFVFDNGNNDRTTPYSHDPAPIPLTSRLVQYRIDPVAMTVSQGFSQAFGGPPLWSKALGNVDVLPVSGHVFGTFAYLYRENGVSNTDLGLGSRTVRLIEVDPSTGDTHWDLRIKGDIGLVPTGYQVDRAIAIGSLYPSDVVEEWLP
ncbi:MAG: aryl-sulfate sulfotransferase [Alphaproteobacteria bacterium]|nr:aryl-sulfate sulfotransferase [Alphaproteobacteria bacterium]MCB9695917.1 aryl-sulfate sulfotransferase [Alphaproteobacteria bacterium]